MWCSPKSRVRRDSSATESRRSHIAKREEARSRVLDRRLGEPSPEIKPVSGLMKNG